ncbi:Osmosensitive K+ channel histidine kinase KdpD [[Actinomadura] parvosata subsp. kistnae]|uniref:histidine kinase n=1 Tax=[Actinomadura] parvosata subsp. kistnae TaxID=1909395 RepID=A0A1U9ZZ30_9ACTN|nr:HAMP domain-containing sensor histidine kinase [Nonomuraea sp. ATCC 55076]AQZ63216.1 two-component sensor histidine kinase [Nonomuraea sp. ATCC 55076]SPL98888.1 Osmosensitive K+ channel histidine kinase KdpD [Actinomadura parvosata subsp. kistnae]
MRPRTLRGRLMAGVLVLLALACATVGVATSLELERFLVSRLDQQLAVAAGRFAVTLEHRGEEAGQEREHADSRGQSVGTLGVRLVNGQVTDAAVVRSRSADDVRVSLSAGDVAALAAVPADGRGHSVELSELDDYRVMATPGADGDVLMGGLPMEGVEATVRRLQVAELVVFAVVMAVAGTAGALWVRLSLRPLQRLAATAERVSTLPLSSGEVALPDRVPVEDPRTEIGGLNAAFNRMLGHVGDALARRHASEQRMRTFAADAGHELRTPLATVRAHTELARRHSGELPAEVGHSLERIEAESARMSTLVDDLLLLARIDAGRPLAREEVDLTRAAIDATGDARVAAPGHRWRLELPEEPVTVAGDAARLYQVVVNLLGNAAVHTPSGTTVTVSVRALPQEVELTVTDDGPGIPEELQGELFERFVRADKARSRAQGGSGLGLAIVKAVIGAHGGAVSVQSRPGRTAFRVTLPAPARRSGAAPQ